VAGRPLDEEYWLKRAREEYAQAEQLVYPKQGGSCWKFPRATSDWLLNARAYGARKAKVTLDALFFQQTVAPSNISELLFVFRKAHLAFRRCR